MWCSNATLNENCKHVNVMWQRSFKRTLQACKLDWREWRERGRWQDSRCQTVKPSGSSASSSWSSSTSRRCSSSIKSQHVDTALTKNLDRFTKVFYFIKRTNFLELSWQHVVGKIDTWVPVGVAAAEWLCPACQTPPPFWSCW